MNALYALLAVAALIGAGLLAGSSTLTGTLLAVAVPYAACAIFLAGICARIWRWAATPVPFRIPTTCGQQKSLDWIKPATFDNPSTGMGAAVRMALEVLLFRSAVPQHPQQRGRRQGVVWREQVSLARSARVSLGAAHDLAPASAAADRACARLRAGLAAGRRLFPGWPSGGVRLRRDCHRGARVFAAAENARADGSLHFVVYRLLRALSAPRNRDFRGADAPRGSGGCRGRQAIRAWPGHLPPGIPGWL